MTFDELDEAVNVGVEASRVLSEVLQELVDTHHCPDAEGSEGLDTSLDCGECVYCLAKRLYKAYRLRHGLVTSRTSYHRHTKPGGLGNDPEQERNMNDLMTASNTEPASLRDLRPGPGWRHMGGPVWGHTSGARIHLIGLVRLPDKTYRSTSNWLENKTWRMMLARNGGNRKRALMSWALIVLARGAGHE